MNIKTEERNGEIWIVWGGEGRIVKGAMKLKSVPGLVYEFQRLTAKEQDERK